MIEVCQVTKRYGHRTVLDDVTATVPRGGITAFIGPNGAGKSTLLSIISRLQRCDRGQVLVDGDDVARTRTDALARKLAILRQENHVTVRLTVRELVSFGRFPYSRGRLTAADRRVVDQTLAYLELDDLHDRFVDQMSGGQRQRAFIGMALCQDTDYVLLDEPLNNLDLRHSVQIMRTLRQLADELAKTIVLVLHDINMAACHADHIIAMKEGRVVRVGPPAEVMTTDVLRLIYDLDIPIVEIDGRRIGAFFW